MSKTLACVNVSRTGKKSKVHVFNSPGDRIFFEDGYSHYIHPAALEGVTGLTIKGLRDAEIHFLGQLVGEQTYWNSYLDNSGVLNIVDCNNVMFSGLNVINKKTFRKGNVSYEASCAVNVSRSRQIQISRSRLTGAGKITLSVHSRSSVFLNDVIVEGYYFELFVAGSTLIADQLTIGQKHVKDENDSHSMLWVTSNHVHGETKAVYSETHVEITDAVLDMITGRSIITGSGTFEKSRVTLRDIRFTQNRAHTFGIVGWGAAYSSLWVDTDFDDEAGDKTVQDPPIDPLPEYVSVPNAGFGKFVNSDSEPTRPMLVGSPIVVDGVSSADVVTSKVPN